MQNKGSCVRKKNPLPRLPPGKGEMQPLLLFHTFSSQETAQNDQSQTCRIERPMAVLSRLRKQRARLVAIGSFVDTAARYALIVCFDQRVFRLICRRHFRVYSSKRRFLVVNLFRLFRRIDRIRIGRRARARRRCRSARFLRIAGIDRRCLFAVRYGNFLNVCETIGDDFSKDSSNGTAPLLANSKQKDIRAFLKKKKRYSF